MIIVAAALALEAWALYVVGVSPERWRPTMIVKDEPAARALYETMIQTIRQADSLSYNSACTSPDYRTTYYKVSLKKPGFFRVDQVNNSPMDKSTVLVGDGSNLSIFWPEDRPYLWCDDTESHEKTKLNVYMRRTVPARDVSIAGEIARLGVAWFGCILDPSTFHGRTDVLDPYIDGIRSRGTDKVEKENCDVIEISYMKAQRIRHLWISRRDHLPRRIKEIVRVADNEIVVEHWSGVSVNADVPSKTFAWSPPEDGRLWSAPTQDDFLPKNGEEAPDFELSAFRGGKIKLSDYRGKVVWLYLWQCGWPQCREELPGLQSLHEQYKDNGLVILGLNCVDDKRIMRVFLRDNPATFPIIHDCSGIARKAVRVDYRNKTVAMPMSCVIDPQGRIVDAWCGYEGNHTRALAALEKAALQPKAGN
jgi:peroxiredoxin/outer membrane lipoprotein-sorting protein